jgi:hypothetical protein
MAEEDDIIQKISLLGAEDIRKELNQLGDDGAAALKKLEEAGSGDLAKGVRNLIPEVAKFEQGMAGAATTAGKLPGIFQRIGQAFQGIRGASIGGQFSKDADAAATAGRTLSQTVRSLGKDIRGLGRVTDLAGLGQFGRSLNLVGRNIGLIAFPALIAGLGGVANSASAAQAQILDLAASVQQTPVAFARAASVVIALGGSFEDAGKVIGKFEQNIQTALASTTAAAAGVEAAKEALEGAGDAADEAAKAFRPLRDEQQKLFFELSAGKLVGLEYTAAQQKLGDQLEETQKRFNKAADAADKAQKALDRARAATTPLEDAFRRVGIVLTDSFTKLPIDEQLKRIAPGFANLGKDVDKTKLAVQLFGEEMGRKFVDALAGGTAGLEAFFKEGERIRPALLAQSKTADLFERTLGKLEQALASVKDAFGLAVAPAFIKFFNDMIDLIVANREGLAEFGRALSTIVGPILEGFLLVVKGIISALGILNPLFNSVASLINKIFGSNLTGAQVFGAVLIGIVGAFAGWVPIIILAVTAISRLVTELAKIDFGPIVTVASNLFKQLITGFTVIGRTIVEAFNGSLQVVIDAWSGTVDFFAGIWNGIVAGVTGVWTFITDAFNNGIKFIVDGFNGAVTAIKGAFDGFLNYLQGWVTAGIGYVQGLITKLRELISAITGVNAAQGNTEAAQQTGFAEGGSVRGPGTGTSDSILARLSNGEFVVKAAAVRAYGTSFLHAINSMRIPSPAFALGGLVDRLSPVRSVPRFAEGGAVAAGARAAFTLQIGGESFGGLSAPQDTADKMVKFATVRSIRKSGARPNWYGNGR